MITLIRERSENNLIRRVLLHTWDLNVKSIPAAFFWSICLIFLIQSSNLYFQSIAVAFGSLTSMLAAHVAQKPSKKPRLQSYLTNSVFKKVLLINFFTGLLFCISLDNLTQNQSDSTQLDLVYRSISLTLFLFWIIEMVIYNTICILSIGEGKDSSITAYFFTYLKQNKIQSFTAVLILFALSPLIFVFCFVGLTLAQGIINITGYELFDEVNGDSLDI
jgi:hypothetical protein